MRYSARQALRQFGLRLRELGQDLLHRKDYAERKGGRQWEDYYRRRWQSGFMRNWAFMRVRFPALNS